jgi:anthranilate phosphoribosyltransferase
MEDILRGKFTTDEIVAFLQYFQKNAATPELLFAFLEAIKASAVFTIDSTHFDKPILDIAGTGGDGKHTVNISTLTGLFCAATGLVKVTKYGNRAASGVCGSMDVLEANGIPIELSQGEIKNTIRAKDFAPLFARSIYPGARYVADARSQIQGSTIFNVLFPLARPITGNPKFVFGVADKKLLDMISEIYIQDKDTRCILVHGLDGTDEVSVTGSGKSEYIFIDGGRIARGEIDCQELFGIQPVALSELQVADKTEAIHLFMEVCDPRSQSAKIEAIRQSIYANSAVALFVGLSPKDMNISQSKEYVSLLKDALHSGKIMKLLQNLQTKNEGIV